MDEDRYDPEPEYTTHDVSGDTDKAVTTQPVARSANAGPPACNIATSLNASMWTAGDMDEDRYDPEPEYTTHDVSGDTDKAVTTQPVARSANAGPPACNI